MASVDFVAQKFQPMPACVLGVARIGDLDPARRQKKFIWLGEDI